MLVHNLIIKKVSSKEGISQTTGNKWQKKVVLLEFDDEFEKSYISASADADYWSSLGYEEGQTVSLHLKFRTKSFMNGFIANDIRIINPNLNLNN